MIKITSKKVITSLIDDSFTQKDYLIYLILSGMFFVKNYVIDMRFGDDYLKTSQSISTILGILNLVTLIILFQINKKIDNAKFLERFIALNLSNRLKILVFIFLPFIFINLYLKGLFNWGMEQYLSNTYILSALIYLFYTIFMIIDFKSLGNRIPISSSETV